MLESDCDEGGRKWGKRRGWVSGKKGYKLRMIIKYSQPAVYVYDVLWQARKKVGSDLRYGNLKLT